jgi:CHAT domain-containing protein
MNRRRLLLFTFVLLTNLLGAPLLHAQAVLNSTVVQAGELVTPLESPPSTINDLLLLLKSYQPDVARIHKLREELARPVPESGIPAELALAWHSKAIVAEQLQEVELRHDYLTKALQYARAAQGDSSGAMGSYLRIRYELAGAKRSAKGIIAALDSYLEFAREIDNRGAHTRGWQFNIAEKLASGYMQLGDLENAKKSLSQMQSIFNVLINQRGKALHVTRWQQHLEATRGQLLHAQGREVESERSMLATLRLGEEALRVNPQREASGIFAPPEERLLASNDDYAIDLAKAYLGQDRLDEAEIAFREVLKRALVRDGRNSILVGKALNNLAVVLMQRGRFEEARVIAQWAEKTMVEAGMSALSPPRFGNQMVLANAWMASGHPDEAVEILDASRSTLTDDARLLEGYGGGSLLSIRAYLLKGRFDDALHDSEKLVKDKRRQLGAESYVLAEARAYRAMVLTRVARESEARNEYEAALRVLLDPSKTPGKQQANAARTIRLHLIISEYLALLVGKGHTPTSTEIARAFLLADVARWQSVQKAVANSALRSAAGSSELANRIKQVQDAEDEIQAVYKNLISQRSAPPERQLPTVIKAMETRIAELQKSEESNLQSIRLQFPQYDELINPRPADVSSATRALHKNESLLSIFTTPAATYIWGLGANGNMHFQVSDKGSDWIVQRVNTLRKSVDLTTGGSPASLRYDSAAGFELYQSLIMPVADAFDSADTLLIVVNGALGQIPFSLLPTKLAPASLRDTDWLMRRWAVAYLPSISNLVTLRSIGAGAKDRSAFIGFGDPDFGTNATSAANSNTRNLLVKAAASSWQSTGDALADSNPTNTSTAATNPAHAAESESVLMPLPDTREEISAIANALNANMGSDVFFGAQASRANVLSADLRRRQVVAFATHGLVAGDLPGLDQPALAMSIAPGRRIQDGLLRLDDILKLSLDADLVVLSACNTAAADGSGAEAVSGLGRGFFYAGARAVLATHWPVESVSARELMTHFFERYAHDPQLTRAQALRHAMIDILESNSTGYAHPAFWAPYALYGDPGR